MTEELITKIGVAAAVILPFWNIPLIVRIIRRKSSADISLWWALGVWVCLLFMAPSGFTSSDMVWKVFNIVNIVFFTCVVAVTLVYRRRR